MTLAERSADAQTERVSLLRRTRSPLRARIVPPRGRRPREQPAAWADMAIAPARRARDPPLHPLIYGIDAVPATEPDGARSPTHRLGAPAIRAVPTRPRHRAGDPPRAAVELPRASRRPRRRWVRTYASFGDDPASYPDGARHRRPPGRAGPLDDPTASGHGPALLATADTDLTAAGSQDRSGIASRAARTSGATRWAVTSRPCAADFAASSVVRERRLDRDCVGTRRICHAPRTSPGVLSAGGLHGFVISDWEGIHRSPATCPQAAPRQRRIDMMMEPTRPGVHRDAHRRGAGREGPDSRIDDAVSRTSQEFELVFRSPAPDRLHIRTVARPRTRAALRAAAHSQVRPRPHHALPSRANDGLRRRSTATASRPGVGVRSRAGGSTHRLPGLPSSTASPARPLRLQFS